MKEERVEDEWITIFSFSQLPVLKQKPDLKSVFGFFTKVIRPTVTDLCSTRPDSPRISLDAVRAAQM